MVNGKKTFITISNESIYKELCELKEQNRIEHQAIMNEIANYKFQVTNVKLALGGIGALTLATLGFLVSHLL